MTTKTNAQRKAESGINCWYCNGGGSAMNPNHRGICAPTQQEREAERMRVEQSKRAGTFGQHVPFKML